MPFFVSLTNNQVMITVKQLFADLMFYFNAINYTLYNRQQLTNDALMIIEFFVSNFSLWYSFNRLMVSNITISNYLIKSNALDELLQNRFDYR